MTQQTITRHHKKAGFTLIEVLVSTGLLVLLLMTATTMMMTFLVSNAKTSIRHTVKGEGSFALAQIEHLIRNAETITANCAQTGTNNTTITMKNFDDANTYTLGISSSGGTNQISYQNTVTLSSELFTSTNADVTNFNLKCYGTDSQNRRIEISFDLTRTVVSVQANTNPITENFRSVVQVRN